MVVSLELGQILQKHCQQFNQIKFKQKITANSELLPTDWYVVRKVETDVAVPSEITAYRTAVRTCYGNLKTAINVASDVNGVLVADLYQNSVGASSG